MKSPVDTVKGRIVQYDPNRQEVTIKAVYPDWFTLSKRQYKECLVQMIDSRPLSNKQRNCCYAMIRSISEYTGMELDLAKTWMKIKFLAEDLNETADKIFSLGDAPMSLVCGFQKFLIDFILSWNIPTNYPLVDMVDDINSYLYSCLKNKKCCVCGQHADLHHVERVGIGRNREEIIHEGMKVLPLCRLHHTEAHQMTKDRFNELYHISDGIKLDKDMCKLYGLKTKEEEDEQSDTYWEIDP